MELTSNGNGSTTGSVTATALAIGSGITSPSYSSGNGVTTSGWANPGNSQSFTEYYEYEVTPTAGKALTVSSVTLNHSISSGSWLVAVYYSYNGFSTSGTQIGSILYLVHKSNRFKFNGTFINGSIRW